MLFRIWLGCFSRCFRWVAWFSGSEACTPPPPMCGVFWRWFFSELSRFCPGIESGRRVFRVSFDGWSCFHRRTYDSPPLFFGVGFVWDYFAGSNCRFVIAFLISVTVFFSMVTIPASQDSPAVALCWKFIDEMTARESSMRTIFACSPLQ